MAESFAGVAGERLLRAKLSKATLTDLSHVVENIVLDHDLRGVVMTGFQTGRNWNAELARYERLVLPSARRVAVFSDGNLAGLGEIHGFRLREQSGLRQEWFIIVVTEEFSCALFGMDNPDEAVPSEEMDRIFDAAWTFEPALIGEFCDLVLAEAAATDPDGAAVIAADIRAFPPKPVLPRFEHMFQTRMFETLEAGRRRWRRQLLHEQEIHDRLQDANDHIARLERLAAVGTTAASLAHELNNPLAAISLAADVLDSHADASPGEDPAAALLSLREQVRSAAERITGTVSRAGRMTRGMLDLVRMSEPALRPLPLDDWLPALIEELSVVHRREISLVITGPNTVNVDPDRLRHIITNLITNAVQASPYDATVAVEVTETAANVELRVVDTGPGIDEELVGELFLPFRTTRASQGGTGLGLALARRFAADLRGTLEFERTGPGGTTMLLVLPSSADVIPATRRVLLVEDDADVRAGLAHMLRRMGWDVFAVESRAKALGVLESVDPELVIIDHDLGDGSTSEQFVEELDKARRGLRSRVLIITGSLASQLSVRDTVPVLFKPFTRAELDTAIQRLLPQTTDRY